MSTLDIKDACVAAAVLLLLPATAIVTGESNAAFGFGVVSIPEESTSADSTKERKATKQRSIETVPWVPLSDNANAALNRLDLPHDAVEQISELLSPGSSLIISDYGISSETGTDTDFIVQTH